MILKFIKSIFRDKFYDDKEVGGSFTFYEETSFGTKVGNIYHILAIGENTITYQMTWYGYKQGGIRKVSKLKFRSLVRGGKYHDSDYLYALRG